MFQKIKDVFFAEGINRVGAIPISDCDIINERILPKTAKSAIIFIIPYRTVNTVAKDGFSEYARIYDYHKFATELYEKIINRLTSITGQNYFGFCDHSPINEKLAAAKSGLGVIGRNSLFIDKCYGSFVFIGSLLTDAILENKVHPIEHCIDCGKCISACPNSAIREQGIDRYSCLSAISQKKNKTQEEKDLLKQHNIVWGCDICQYACPYNEKAELSTIAHFKNTRIGFIDKSFVESLSDNAFQKYAFSYKGRKIVLDNIDFI